MWYLISPLGGQYWKTEERELWPGIPLCFELKGFDILKIGENRFFHTALAPQKDISWLDWAVSTGSISSALVHSPQHQVWQYFDTFFDNVMDKWI